MSTVATAASPNAPNINLDAFEHEYFNADTFVKKIAAESVYSSSIAETKEKLNRSAQQTAEEIKQSVYKNYTNFMETAKEVGHLEGKMTQMRQSLEEQRKLLNLFTNLNINANQANDPNTASKTGSNNSAPKSSISLILEQVEGCGLIAQKAERNLLYHTDLEALHLDDFSVSHKLHAYLLNDSLLLALPQRKRTKSNFPTLPGRSGSTGGMASKLNESHGYQFKFQALYELTEIKTLNIEDSKEVRNSFQVLKFPESLAFRCANAHIKKEWLENIGTYLIINSIIKDNCTYMGGGEMNKINPGSIPNQKKKLKIIFVCYDVYIRNIKHLIKK